MFRKRTGKVIYLHVVEHKGVVAVTKTTDAATTQHDSPEHKAQPEQEDPIMNTKANEKEWEERRPVPGFAKDKRLSLEFIGLILLPMLGVDSTLLHLDNSYNSDAATQATFGLGWAAGIDEMDLLFSSFKVTVLFPAVVVVQASIEENDKGWISGALLFSTYLIISIAAWFQK
ncbi:hypothetical protein B7463_g12454, partial [Scytalidium lignicola]